MTRKLFTILAALPLLILSCDKPTAEPEPENPTNYFVYEGYSFDINSVVKYDKGDNTVELWLSSEIGLTTISAIEKAGDYVILNTSKEYLGKRDRFNAGSSKGSFIRFGQNKEFAYGNNGTAYIEIAIDGEQVILSFLAQNLYTKAEQTIKAAIKGSYEGSFVTEVEMPYENAWGLDRSRNALTSARYTTYENGNDAKITLYGENNDEAIKLILSPSLIGRQIYLPASGSLALTYDRGLNFNLDNASGSIKTSFSESIIEVSVDITDGKKRIRASYDGAYESDLVKENRYKYEYEGESPYEGRHEIVKLMVENKGGQCKLFFSPSDGYSMSTANYTHMPILKVPTEIINAGKKSFMELENWEFAFDLMQVWPYNDEYQPHPAKTDWIEINQSGNTYEVEFILSSIATGMPYSSMDVYFNGPASK